MSCGGLLWATFKAHTTQIALPPSVLEPEYKIDDLVLKDKLKESIPRMFWNNEFFPPQTHLFLGKPLGHRTRRLNFVLPPWPKPFPRTHTG